MAADKGGQASLSERMRPDESVSLLTRSIARIRALGATPLLHPVLIAVYPVVFLWSRNAGEHPPFSEVTEALFMMLGLAAVVFLALGLVIRDAACAAIGTSVFVLLFSVFGRAELWLRVTPGSGLETALLLGFGLLAAAVILLVRSSTVSMEQATQGLNLVAAVLVVLNLGPFVLGFQFAHGGGPVAASPVSVEGLDPTAVGPERDVYYLIFDRYANEHTLRDLYEFDDSGFIGWLQDQRFTVIHDALANYPQTTHSLASSLNMTYLDSFAQHVGTKSGYWGPLFDSLSATSASQAFQHLGYRYEHIGSWWAPSATDRTADDNLTFSGAPEFTSSFRSVTAWGSVLERLGLGPNDYREKWRWIQAQEAAVRQIAADPRPTFTFAHFLLPHSPYVFHADGSFVPPDPSRPRVDAYLDQLRYTNTVIESVVTDLLSAPGPAPVIVVQSDEGPYPPAFDSDTEPFHQPWGEASDVDLGRKLRILNAFFLPGGVRQPYPTITPVNTFRLILNDYFGADLPLLPDRTFVFVAYTKPYQFADVTQRLRGG